MIAGLRDLNAEGGSEFLASLADLFLSEAAACLDELRDAVARDDSEAMRHLGHHLSGSSYAVGARRLAALSRQMEQHGLDNRDAAAGRALLAALVKEFAQVRNALAIEVGRPDGGRLQR
jgi:HPt (histidine-containing phosphotransfer) domain-containing protein